MSSDSFADGVEFGRLWRVVNDLYARIREGDVAVDPSGHFRSRDAVCISDALRQNIFDELAAPMAASLLSLFKRPIPVDGDYVLPLHIPYSECSACASPLGLQIPVALSPEGNFSATAARIVGCSQKTGALIGDGCCPFPNGFPPYTLHLDTPSGTLVIRDDLREFFPGGDILDKSGEPAEHAYVRAHEANGLLHGYVGNSMPSVYANIDVLLIAAHQGKSMRDPVTGTRLSRRGTIDTGLWWFSIADYDTLRAKAIGQQDMFTFNEVLKDEHTTRVRMRPGRYELTYNWTSGGNRGSEEKNLIYARMERKG